jgi:hypothetical protein
MAWGSPKPALAIPHAKRMPAEAKAREALRRDEIAREALRRRVAERERLAAEKETLRHLALCGFCKRLNRFADGTCEHCGAPRAS